MVSKGICFGALSVLLVQCESRGLQLQRRIRKLPAQPIDPWPKSLSDASVAKFPIAIFL